MTYEKRDFIFNYDPIFDDLFHNKFDITWQKNLPDIDPNRVFSIIDPELKSGGIDDKTITYQYNKDSFRSDGFTNNHDGKHILFSGCSETEGVGGNLEDAWPHILYKKISEKEKCSGFFNLGKSGWGWSRIVLNSLIYFNKYGYPDVYFILLPNHQRKFYYREDLKSMPKISEWIYFQVYPDVLDIPKLDKTSTPKEYLEDFVFFLINWKTFCELCKSNNVKLIFSTWDGIDSMSLNNNLFDEYLALEESKLHKYINEYYETHAIKKDDYKKRDGHNGRVFHHFYAKEFYEKYKELGK